MRSSGRWVGIGGGRVSGLVVVYIREYMARGYSRGIKIKRLGLVRGRGGGLCLAKNFTKKRILKSPISTKFVFI